MAYVLRRVIVQDVEAEKECYRATAAERRRHGVARETYFVDPQRPHELVIAFDGDAVDQLYAALRASEADAAPCQPASPRRAEAPPPPAPGELEAVLAAAEAAQQGLGLQPRALLSAAGLPQAAR